MRLDGAVGASAIMLERTGTEPGLSMYRHYGKRAIDLLCSALLLTLLAPLIALLGLASWFVMGRPVFFVQTRPGRGGVPFRMVKFRTMRSALDADGRPRPDAERITGWGAWMRALSLDELPELWNVIRGDMSLVGPRPLLMDYLELYSPEQRRRHDVRPGITGWAQVHGRNAVTWEERFALDVWYVDRLSLWLDLKVLARTAVSVLRREGIAAPGHATMPPFTGRRAE